MPPTLWPQSEIDELMRLWDNYSASQIGAMLGRTRNAVIGKINRLCNAKLYQRNGHKIYLDRRPRMPRQPSPPKLEVKVEQPPPQPIIVKPTRPCTIYKLNHRRCHWPLGDTYEPATWFCGEKVLDGRPYCRCHCEIAYQGFHCPDQVPEGREA